MLVAPGPRHSTYDVYAGYEKYFKRREDVEFFSYPYHNILDYHKAAQVFLNPSLPEDDMDRIAVSRATRELLGWIAYTNPDFVLFIAGTAYPMDLYAKIKEMQHSFVSPFALGIYFTESPYMDSIQEKYLPILDFAFFSDKLSAEKFNPDGSLYIEYLPHSFDPEKHNADREVSEQYNRDVFFCGTPFYERQEMIASVDWEKKGIDLSLFGLWNEDYVSEEYMQKLQRYIESDRTLDNLEVSKYYKGSKVSINIHRTRADIGGNGEEIDNVTEAYSTGPRTFEVVASGGFLLSDYRKEIEDIFGESVLYFKNKYDFSSMIDKALSMPESEREKMKAAARQKISNCTFADRINDIILPMFIDIKKVYG